MLLYLLKKNMTKYTSLLFVLVLAVALVSCSSGPTSTSTAGVDLSLYESQSIAGSSIKKISRDHPTGELYEEGFVDNGVKEGTWTTYYPEAGYIQSISSFEKGFFTGPYIEFDERGRLLKQANYINNELDGLYGEFKNGRPTIKIMYKKGKINGFYREFNNKSQVIKESMYKDNVLDGTVRNYNDEGKLVLEYIYKNGEKISGGIVE